MDSNDTRRYFPGFGDENSMSGHDYEELMTPLGYNVAAACLFLIGFFGFFTNLVVIVLMCREKQLWTPLNVILFNLVMSDFSISIFGNPFTLASALAHRWLFGRVMCVVYGFFMALLGISSITTLTVLAFERYLMISRPFQNHLLNHRTAITLVFGIWIYAAFITAPPLFGWGDYVNESANISCSVNWESRNYNAMTYIIYLFVFGLFVPVIVICYSYLNIIRTIKKNVRTMGSVTKAEKKVALMIAVMIIAFFFAWTPYAVLALLIAFADTDVAPWLGVLPALIAKSSICYNPIIYVGLNTQFRSAWRRLLGVRDTFETSGEVIGTMASMNNLSQSLIKDTSIRDLTKKKSNSTSVVVKLDSAKDQQPITKLYKNSNSEQNGPRTSFFHKNTSKEKEKKKKKKKRNSDNTQKETKDNGLELCYMDNRPEHSL